MLDLTRTIRRRLGGGWKLKLADLLEKASPARAHEMRMRVWQQRHRHLAGAYRGRSAILLTCGPSLQQVWSEQLEKLASRHVVIAVKQAIDLTGALPDFHLFNECRMKTYHYPAPTIRLSVSKYLEDHPCEIHYPIRRYDWDQALFVTNQYDRWELSRSWERPWGIGILFEMGLQLPAYLGCRRLVIVGFDMNPEGRYHFYDENQKQDSRHYSVDPREFEFAKRTVPHYLAWAKKKQMQVRLYSPLSALPFDRLDSLTQTASFLEA